jgi:hypothetical protein
MGLSNIINAYARKDTIVPVTDLKEFRNERFSLKKLSSKNDVYGDIIGKIKDTYNNQSSSRNIGTAVVTELTYTKEGKIATVIIRKPMLDLVA